MKIIKNYRQTPVLRAGFNRLARQTFGLDFEGWYQNGFWTDCYEPYSVVENGEIVANVSVNRIGLQIGDTVYNTIQLGTVMTAEAYRKRGYIRAILEEIDQDIAGNDGVFLFANDEVLSFYPKFGFTQCQEYRYTRRVNQSGACTVKQVPMDGPEAWSRLRRAIEENVFRTGCVMVGNPGLIFFYASQFMRDCVYYDPGLDAWAIAEVEDGHLLLHEVYSSRPVELDAVVAAFGADIKQVTLGFSPADPTGFTCQAFREEDTTFFVKGALWDSFSKKRLRIPTLAHA